MVSSPHGCTLRWTTPTGRISSPNLGRSPRRGQVLNQTPSRPLLPARHEEPPARQRLPATNSPPYGLSLLPCPSNTAAPQRARTLPAALSASTLSSPTAEYSTPEACFRTSRTNQKRFPRDLQPTQRCHRERNKGAVQTARTNIPS